MSWYVVWELYMHFHVHMMYWDFLYCDKLSNILIKILYD
jgi:hypothetical protein